jgi:ABC-2 type transport system permease protein
MSVETTNGVIHDIGYQRYDGPRLGRGYAARSLYTHGVRTAFGLGRSAKAKIFPWAVVGIVGLVAAVVTAIRAQVGETVMSYWAFPSNLSILMVLFCAVVGPELVSRDIRSGVLSLYFSRPLTRTDYALTKFAALATACFLLMAGPQLLMFLGGAFSVDGLPAVWDEFVDFSKGLAASALFGITLAALSILVASLSGRRAVAAALVVAVFLVTTPIYAMIIGIAFGTSPDGVPTGSALQAIQLAGLVSPTTLVGGVVEWWFIPPVPVTENPVSIGSYGPLYGAVTLGLIIVCLLLLLLRYRKVAR